MILPKVIEDLILDYKEDMEDCETRMHYAFRMFLNIQASAHFLRNQITTLRETTPAWFAVCKILSTATAVMQSLLEEFTHVKMEELFDLQNSIDNSIIHCIMLCSLEPLVHSVEDSASDNEAESHIPPPTLMGSL